jgi:hypothetical protein
VSKPLGFLSSDASQGAVALEQIRNLDPMEQARASAGTDGAASADPSAAERDQLARDIAAIERASAELRKAEPALMSWVDLPVRSSQQPRPIWLLIGLLWVSTALVTLGAVYALSAFVG